MIVIGVVYAWGECIITVASSSAEQMGEEVSILSMFLPFK